MNQTEKFSINHESFAKGHVVYLSGQLDLSVVPEFKAAIEPLAQHVEEPLTLNLRALQYIDSSGIGMFIYLLKLREGIDAPLYVEDVPPKIQRLFDLTGISKFLTSPNQEVKVERTGTHDA
jgi:anti-sigma B factor antagonist